MRDEKNKNSSRENKYESEVIPDHKKTKWDVVDYENCKTSTTNRKVENSKTLKQIGEDRASCWHRQIRERVGA